MNEPLLNGIVVYPVKSLMGITVPSWQVSATGLQHDRKWMLIDNDGHFLSQRVLPRMALIKTAICGAQLILSAQDMADLHLPLQPTSGQPVSCVIWHDQCTALWISSEADQWFSEFLKQPCRLVYQPDSSVRQVDPAYANTADQVAFSDGFPFLIISENSLVSLNQAMNLDLTMNRFRPNLIISGCAAYAEDSWREIRIGHIDFRLPKPCSRCSVPTIDPETAETGKEPLSTLNRLRKWQNKVYFGQNALHNQVGQLTVGDNIQIIRTDTRQPPL
ncbi:MAG: MOSC N-terminal beta barrel domain-containing protein [Methylococcales bacterium]